MENDVASRQLHDRATRGERLSQEEQARLDQWYARHDQEESSVLGQGSATSPSAALQARVDDAVSRLSAVTGRIQAISVENATMRREIAALESQLTQGA